MHKDFNGAWKISREAFRKFVFSKLELFHMYNLEQMGYGLADRGFESRQGLGIFLSTAAS